MIQITIGNDVMSIHEGCRDYPPGGPKDSDQFAVRSCLLVEEADQPVGEPDVTTGGEVEQSLLGVVRQTEAEDELTHRQIEIVKLIAQGRAAKEIAFELGLSSKTVDVHRARIMERLSLNDVASLTLYAVRKGLIKP